jgi:hypothetical protein
LRHNARAATAASRQSLQPRPGNCMEFVHFLANFPGRNA